MNARSSHEGEELATLFDGKAGHVGEELADRAAVHGEAVVGLGRVRQGCRTRG